MNSRIQRRHKKQLQNLVGTPVQWDCMLADFTSFGIGGPADALLRVETLAELRRVHDFIRHNGLPWFLLGRGTNLLVQDSGFAGIAIMLEGSFKALKIDFTGDSASVVVGAGHSLGKLLSLCIEKGCSGLEFTSGIPGSVGGAVSMNAGAWGGSMSDVLQEVEIFDEHGPRRHPKEQLKFGYRSFMRADTEKGIITAATLKLGREDSTVLRMRCRQYREKRKENQPVKHGSAGSIFKNPPGDKAGRLIDVNGLKGTTVGDAQISTKHANFIVNRGRASSADVLALMERVQKTVQANSGIFLEPEVCIL
ncbi:MAG: UDP-N-acetylmuramate dehydrogenase [Desulfopila sp.]